MRLAVEVSGVDELFGGERERLADMGPVLGGFAPRLYESIMKNFEAGGRPPWAPLDPEYARRKADRGHPRNILVRTGAMKSGVGVAAGPGKIATFSAAPYSSVHQHGDAKRNIPSRPFLDIQDGDREELVRMIGDYITGAG